MEALAINVVVLRAQLALSQAALAARANIARATISKVEAGDGNVTVASVEKIARVLGCGVEELFEYEEDHPDEEELVRRANAPRSERIDARQLQEAIDEALASRYSRAGRKSSLARNLRQGREKKRS
jgi:transcriptional regulator with XRE-family HTH domain